MVMRAMILENLNSEEKKWRFLVRSAVSCFENCRSVKPKLPLPLRWIFHSQILYTCRYRASQLSTLSDFLVCGKR